MKSCFLGGEDPNLLDGQNANSGRTNESDVADDGSLTHWETLTADEAVHYDEDGLPVSADDLAGIHNSVLEDLIDFDLEEANLSNPNSVNRIDLGYQDENRTAGKRGVNGDLDSSVVQNIRLGFAGFGQPTRTKKTEDSYIERAELLWRRATTELKIKNDDMDCMQFVVWLIRKKPTLSKATWRQYKSACMYWLNSIKGTVDARRATDLLAPETAFGCLEKTNRTSAMRVKNVSNKEFMNFLGCFNSFDSKWKSFAGLTKTWMLLGSRTSLRPHEWEQAVLLRSVSADHEKVIDGTLVAGRTYLQVRNSKNTNGRANGDYRHLDVTDFGAPVWDAISMFCDYMSDPERYKRAYENCVKFLQDANRYYFGLDSQKSKSSQKHFMLYTGRHRFASEAKNTMGDKEVAASMGHANNKTAYSMYGNARYAKGGQMLAKPVDKEAKTVRSISKAKEFLSAKGEQVSAPADKSKS